MKWGRPIGGALSRRSSRRLKVTLLHGRHPKGFRKIQRVPEGFIRGSRPYQKCLCKGSNVCCRCRRGGGDDAQIYRRAYSRNVVQFPSTGNHSFRLSRRNYVRINQLNIGAFTEWPKPSGIFESYFCRWNRRPWGRDGSTMATGGGHGAWCRRRQSAKS